MPAEWDIRYWPQCLRHVFLSHCQEDRETLVRPVFEELGRRGFSPWIDEVHYPISRQGFETLREELLTCRHVVYFLTPAALRQGRGWMQAERAYADTIQSRLAYHGEMAHVELPLLFIARDDPVYQRSSWRALLDKAQVYDQISAPVEWAATRIELFIRQEEDWARDLATRFAQDNRLSDHFSHDPNLRRRLLAESPPPG